VTEELFDKRVRSVKKMVSFLNGLFERQPEITWDEIGKHLTEEGYYKPTLLKRNTINQIIKYHLKKNGYKIEKCRKIVRVKND